MLEETYRDFKTDLDSLKILGFQEKSVTLNQDTLGVSYTQAGVCVLLKRLKVKLKTGRPSNVRKVEGSEEAFKKCLTCWHNIPMLPLSLKMRCDTAHAQTMFSNNSTNRTSYRFLPHTIPTEPRKGYQHH